VRALRTYLVLSAASFEFYSSTPSRGNVIDDTNGVPVGHFPAAHPAIQLASKLPLFVGLDWRFSRGRLSPVSNCPTERTPTTDFHRPDERIMSTLVINQQEAFPHAT
jgi:hypothetical protein